MRVFGPPLNDRGPVLAESVIEMPEPAAPPQILFPNLEGRRPQEEPEVFLGFFLGKQLLKTRFRIGNTQEKRRAQRGNQDQADQRLQPIFAVAQEQPEKEQERTT